MASDAPKKPEKNPSAPQADALLDTSETSRANQKVELDIEDAPFLKEEEAKPEPEPAAETQPEPPPKEAKKSPGRKKIIFAALAAVLVALVATVAVKFLSHSPASPPPGRKTPAGSAAAKLPPAKAEYQVQLEPFMVEQKYGDDIRFLTVKMLLTTHDSGMVQELQGKLIPIRNAIFYYLKNKDVQFLADENNAGKLKHELLLVVNQYVSDGKFDNVLFEQYVVK